MLLLLPDLLTECQSAEMNVEKPRCMSKMADVKPAADTVAMTNTHLHTPYSTPTAATATVYNTSQSTQTNINIDRFMHSSIDQ